MVPNTKERGKKIYTYYIQTQNGQIAMTTF